MRKADQISAPDDMIAAYHELCQGQRMEQEEMDEQLDDNEIEAMEKLAQVEFSIDRLWLVNGVGNIKRILSRGLLHEAHVAYV